MVHTYAKLGLGLLLVASVLTNAVREMKQDEGQTGDTDQNSYGIAKPCDPNTNNFEFTWTPKKFTLSQALTVSLNMTLNADFIIGYGSFKVFVRATKDSIESEYGYSGSITCPDLLDMLRSSQVITNIEPKKKCPIRKGEIIQMTYSWGAMPNVLFGYLTANILITSEPHGGHVFLCFNASTYIKEPDW